MYGHMKSLTGISAPKMSEWMGVCIWLDLCNEGHAFIRQRPFLKDSIALKGRRGFRVISHEEEIYRVSRFLQ